MEHTIKVKIIVETKGLKLFDSTSSHEIKKLLSFDCGTAMIEKESILEFADIQGNSRSWKVVEVQTEFYDKTQRESIDYNSESIGVGPFDLVLYYEVEAV